MINPTATILMLCVLVCNTATAQTRRIDYLKQQILQAKTLDEQGKAMLVLCGDKYSLHGDSMRHYALEAKSIAEQLADKEMALWSDYYIGYSYMITGRLDTAKAIAQQQLVKLNYNSNRELYSAFAILKAMASYKGNQPREAMKDMFDLQQLTREDSGSVLNIETSNMIALSYSALNQYEESLKWQVKALKANKPQIVSRPFVEQLARSYMGISISYVHLFEDKKTQRFADSSLYYARLADTLCKQHEVLFFYCQSQILQGYYYSYAKQPALAEHYLRNGINTRKFLGDPAYVASDMSVLGTFYATTNQPDKGIAICKEGIAMCEKYQLTIQLFVLLHNALAQNYLVAKDYKMYGETLQHLLHLRDSVSGKIASEEINKLHSNYELKQHEITIAQQHLDITRKNYQFFGLLALGGLAACIVGVIFFYYKKKQQLKLRFIQEGEKRLAEQSIREAEEKQRKQIASELHDNIGAQVSFISSNIDWIVDSPVEISYDEQKMRLGVIHETSKDVMRNLRETLWALNRDEIALDELSDKLKMYVQAIAKFRPSTTFHNKEDITSSIRLNPVQALNIFRIMQESVSNILKHSMATELHLHTSTNGQAFELTLTDNGKGFDPSTIEGEHYGLKNMQHRAAEAGITVKITSQNGLGTNVQVRGVSEM
jgi:signal transduction histidine kinase